MYRLTFPDPGIGLEGWHVCVTLFISPIIAIIGDICMTVEPTCTYDNQITLYYPVFVVLSFCTFVRTL